MRIKIISVVLFLILSLVVIFYYSKSKYYELVLVNNSQPICLVLINEDTNGYDTSTFVLKNKIIIETRNSIWKTHFYIKDKQNLKLINLKYTPVNRNLKLEFNSFRNQIEYKFSDGKLKSKGKISLTNSVDVP